MLRRRMMMQSEGGSKEPNSILSWGIPISCGVIKKPNTTCFAEFKCEDENIQSLIIGDAIKSDGFVAFSYGEKYNHLTFRIGSRYGFFGDVKEKHSVRIENETGYGYKDGKLLLKGTTSITEERTIKICGYGVRIYNAKIFEGDELVRELIPTKIGNDYGFFDKVDGGFYTAPYFTE